MKLNPAVCVYVGDAAQDVEMAHAPVCVPSAFSAVPHRKTPARRPTDFCSNRWTNCPAYLKPLAAVSPGEDFRENCLMALRAGRPEPQRGAAAAGVAGAA